MVEYGPISVKDKKFVGIGKFLFDTSNVEWNIPHLHFLINRDGDQFEATNIEFGLVASGHDQEEATKQLASLIHFYITAVMTKGRGYVEFIEAVKSNAMDDYWKAYRVLDFSLGAKGKDLSHEIEKRIMRAIQAMFDEQLEEIITQKAQKTAEELLKVFKELSAFKLVDVEYAELKDAA